MSTGESLNLCQYAEYDSPLQLFRCRYEGKCSDKLEAGEGYNCTRIVIHDREELIRYVLAARERELEDSRVSV